MKKILILLILSFLTTTVHSQIEQAKIVTGSNSGDGELKAAFILLNAATMRLYNITEQNVDSLAAHYMRIGRLRNRLDSIFYTNIVLNPRSDPPDNPIQGMVYFDTDDKSFYGYNGENWINLQQDDTQ